MRPWLKGFKFSCVECGKCCKGSRTNVYVNPAEIGAMAEHLGLEFSEFTRRYTEDRAVDIGTSTSLTNVAGGCSMLGEDRKTCRVHDVKPTQCKTYPYWAPSLVSEAELQTESQRCPGIGEGSVVDEEVILRNMVVNQIHGRGVGENWVYDEAMDLIKEAEESQPSMLQSFADEFYSLNASKVVHEGEDLRVVESMVSGQQTSRRLEFKSSLDMTQSEIYLADDGSVDHSVLALPIHKALASVATSAVTDKSSARIAMIGGGACVLPSHLLHTSSIRLLIEVVEPHAEVSQLAQEHFAANFKVDNSGGDGGMTLHAMTGQEYLCGDGVPALDVLLLDAMDSLPLSVFTKHKADEGHDEYVAPPPALLEVPAMLLKHLDRPMGCLVVNLLGPTEYLVAVYKMLTTAEGAEHDHALFSVEASPNSILVVMPRPTDESEQKAQALRMNIIARNLLYSDLGAQAFRFNEYGEKEPLDILD